MEQIQFGGSEGRFSIESIQPVALHVMRIIYAGGMPDGSLYSEPITIYSQGGIKETTLTGWTTIYYQDPDNRTIYLSDDGSVYTEPETTEPEPEPDEEPTLEDVQAYKIAEMESACQKTVKAGVDVELSDGSDHFSLDTSEQLSLYVRQFEIDHGAEEIDFYADGKLSKYYSAEDMQTIIDTAFDFIDYQETYCNELVLWIESMTDIEEVEAVYYGMEIPEERRSSVLSDLIFHSKDELHDEEDDKDDSGDDSGDDSDDDNQNAGGRMDLGGND